MSPASPVRPVALVTGASRGIGLAIARDLGRDHHVLVGGRDTASVSRIVSELESAEPFVTDLTNDELPTVPKRVDVLVHSAAVGGFLAPIAELSREQWRAVFEVNVFAVAELTRLLLPALRRADGLVITINSGSGFVSNARSALYSASKFALRAFTDALREEERGRVRVSSVHPGRVDTDMQRSLVDQEGDEYDARFTITPEMIAQAVRAVVDMPHSGTVESLSVRPVHKR